MATLFRGFLDYYNNYPFNDYIISIKHGIIITIVMTSGGAVSVKNVSFSGRTWFPMCILDPFDVRRNLGNVFNKNNYQRTLDVLSAAAAATDLMSLVT